MLKYTITELRQACTEHRIQWSMHAIKRMRERGINSVDFKHSIMTGEIIEEYPEDYPHPSCLVSGVNMKTLPLHTVSGYDEGFIYAITAYYPDVNEWENDYKTRRVK